jgi:hypothetical protein
MIAWLKSTVGIVTAIGVAVALLIFVFKFGTIKDAIQSRLYNSKTTSSVAHGDSANASKALADTAHAQGIVVRSSYNALKASPRVRNNPVALEVSNSADKVIGKADTEVVNLRSANTQLERQVHDLQTRPPEPTPRATIYVDPLYSFSNVRRPMIVARVGVDYRLLPHVSAKVEVGYMPPPPSSTKQSAEFVANVGAHITF